MLKQNFILVTISLLSFLSTNGQSLLPEFPIDSLTGKITYTDVVVIDSITEPTKLFSIAREWFAKSYNSSNHVIQMEDKENGKLIGRATIPVTYTGSFNTHWEGGYIDYTIALYFKQGRYKYEISDFIHHGTLVQGEKTPDGGPCENLLKTKKGFWSLPYKKTYLLYLIQMDEKTKELIIDLKSFVQMKVKEKPENGW